MQYLHLQVCICTPIVLQTFKPPNPDDAPNVHQGTSNTKHPKDSSKHLNHSRSTL